VSDQAATRYRDRVALLLHLARGGRFSAIPAAGLVGAVLLVAASRFASWSAGSATAMLRTSAVVLAAGAVFALDDAAAETLTASPTSLIRRRGVVLGLALAGVATAWGLLVGLGDALLPAAESARLAMVDGRLTLELAVLTTVAVAIGTVVARSNPTAAGITAGPGIVLAFVAAQQGNDHLTLFADGPLDVAWTAARGRLWLAIAVAGLVALWSSRDPWRRRRSATTVATVLALMVATGATAAMVTAGPDDASTTARLDATLREFVAAQRIERLGVGVSGADGVWIRSLVDGEVRAPSSP
jgi:hypothetical protein